MLQQTPRAVTDELPCAVTFPPPVAVVSVIFVIVVVVMVGGVSSAFFLQVVRVKRNITKITDSARTDSKLFVFIIPLIK